MTEIYFAGLRRSTTVPAAEVWDFERAPLNLLHTFATTRKVREAELETYGKHCTYLLDSGAFSAFTTNTKIDIDALLREPLELPQYTEAVALDVIGDWRASRENAFYMLSKSDPLHSMPVFHYGDPWELLDEYCKHWPRVGLSASVIRSMKQCKQWFGDCFARAWPHLFHSFGRTSSSVLMRFPFDTADSTSWLSVGLYGTVRAVPSDGLDSRRPPQVRLCGRQVTTNNPSHMHMEWVSVLRQQHFLRHKWCSELNPLRKKAGLREIFPDDTALDGRLER